MLKYIYWYKELTFQLVTTEFLISRIHIFTSNKIIIDINKGSWYLKLPLQLVKIELLIS